MRKEMFRRGVTLILAIGLSSTFALAQASGTDSQQATRLRTLKTAGPTAPVTIYPVRALGRPSREIADALGLVVEKSGMVNAEAADGAFDLPTGTAWADAPARFAEFLKSSPPTSGYALYAEFLGDPKTGPTEVRWLILDSSGGLVISDRQVPTDADFQRTAARDPDPLGCSTLVAERIFSTLEWKRTAGPGRPGKFAARWAEKSGTPSEAEQAAMKSRLGKLKQSLKTASISVYAPRLGNAHDAQSAARLAQELRKRCGCPATASAIAPPFEIKPTSNQQKRLWDLARGFRDYLRANPPETDHALLAEYLMDSASAVHSVNFVICDKSGDWVIVDFQNNQHADFQRVAPKSIADCERLTCERLAGYLR